MGVVRGGEESFCQVLLYLTVHVPRAHMVVLCHITGYGIPAVVCDGWHDGGRFHYARRQDKVLQMQGPRAHKGVKQMSLIAAS